MANIQTAIDSRPMGEMNTTPLIDVMLVLLIMFIMTIPMATQSLEVEVGGERGDLVPNSIRNVVSIAPDDAIAWNGAGVTRPQLKSLLRQTRAMPVEPELQFRPDGSASYAVAAEVTNIIKRSGVTRFGFVDNEKYVQFGRAETSAAATN